MNWLILLLAGGIIATIGGALLATQLLRAPAGAGAGSVAGQRPQRAARPGAEEKRIERLRKQHEREEKQRLKAIRRVAGTLRQEIVEALAQQGFIYIYERQGAVAKASKPEIRVVLYSSDAIYYRIDKLPFRKTYSDLMAPEVATNLSLSIRRECSIISNTDLGVWIQVGLKSGISAIPKLFPWSSDETAQNALELLPKQRRWAVPIGIAENRRFIYEDARSWPHLLVAGATGGGKSVFLNQLLCTLIQRNTPEQLELVLIDLKGGLEFWPYQEIPHLRRPVAVEREEVAPVLMDIRQEKERRFQLFRNAGVKDIGGWNSTHTNKLPYVFVIFDEIANLMLDTKIKGQVELLIQDLAAQGRALGLHLILCTQVPNKAVLSRIILSNIVCRIAFNSDLTGSMLIVGNGRAAQLPPGGRMIYRRSNSMIECQAPLITQEQTEQVIASLLPAEEDKVTEQDLFKLALHNHGGLFSYRVLYDSCQGNASNTWIRSVAKSWQYDYKRQEPVIEVEGQRYVLGRVTIPGGGRSRGLVPVNGHLPQDQAEMDQLWAAANQQE